MCVHFHPCLTQKSLPRDGMCHFLNSFPIMRRSAYPNALSLALLFSRESLLSGIYLTTELINMGRHSGFKQLLQTKRAITGWKLQSCACMCVRVCVCSFSLQTIRPWNKSTADKACPPPAPLGNEKHVLSSINRQKCHRISARLTQASVRREAH